MDPAERRLAVPVEDHSMAAGEFEGVHEGARRGSGAVIVWDEGTADVHEESPDHLAVTLRGTKLNGRFVIRLAIGNARTRREHVRGAWDIIRGKAAELQGSRAG